MIPALLAGATVCTVSAVYWVLRLVRFRLRLKVASHSTVSRGGSFRGDINGLRAWAVVAVVLYHFNVPGFSGGFAGVDVFFVISGFLMAGIVCKGLAAQRFSLGSFYLARARRIVPALMVLVIVLLALGWILLMPREYQTLGKHARESLLFTSNLRYLDEAGYFDSASHEKRRAYMVAFDRVAILHALPFTAAGAEQCSSRAAVFVGGAPAWIGRLFRDLPIPECSPAGVGVFFAAIARLGNAVGRCGLSAG